VEKRNQTKFKMMPIDDQLLMGRRLVPVGFPWLGLSQNESMGSSEVWCRAKDVRSLPHQALFLPWKGRSHPSQSIYAPIFHIVERDKVESENGWFKYDGELII
jgi:hypothetical protein